MVLTTLIGSALGFGSSLAPSIMQFMQDGKDKKHELKSLEMQIALMDKKSEMVVEEAQVTGEMNAIALEIQAEIESIKGAHQPMQALGIGWVDALRGSVRPIVTYWFMGLYSYAKYSAYVNSEVVWGEMDQALFATILAFWFGDRIKKYYNKAS